MSDSATLGDKQPIQWLDGFSCSECRVTLPPHDDYFDEYFRTGAATCPACGKKVDFWAMATEFVDKEFVNEWIAFRSVGAVVSHRSYELLPGTIVAVSLSDLGVPEDAEVLSVGISTIGVGDSKPVFPCLAVQNGLILDPFPREFVLYGRGTGEPTARSFAQVSVKWHPVSELEVSYHHLADAARRFAAKKYLAMVVPANIAVEAALTPVLNRWVRQYCGPDDADRFLSGHGASYAHQLRVVSRISARTLGLPEMPGRLRNLIDELRSYRNEIVHRGRLDHKKQALTYSKALLFLIAASFGVEYARFLRRALDGSNAGSPAEGDSREATPA